MPPGAQRIVSQRSGSWNMPEVRPIALGGPVLPKVWLGYSTEPILWADICPQQIDHGPRSAVVGEVCVVLCFFHITVGPNTPWSLRPRVGTCSSTPNICSLKPWQDLPETFLELRSICAGTMSNREVLRRSSRRGKCDVTREAQEARAWQVRGRGR